jgi:hypothetical protein
LKQLEEQQEMDLSPYALFVYSISPYTKETYFRRLRRFFDAISLDGTTFENRCNKFAEKAKGKQMLVGPLIPFLFTHNRRRKR